ncbi:TPA: tape measure protein [Klebsiella variicola]
MSDIVDFKLTLDDKEFSASIKNAGKLLGTFGTTASNNSKKMASLERAVNSASRAISVFGVSLDKGSGKLEDFSAGAELAAGALGSIRDSLTSINRSLKTFSDRVDQVGGKVDQLANSLKKAQSELLEFSDWTEHAARSARTFSGNIGEMGSVTTSLNRRISNTSQIFDRWKGTTDKAAEGLKNVKAQMDGILTRQDQLKGKLLGGGSVGGGTGGGGTGRPSSGNGSSTASRRDSGIFDGLKGNIFLLGEIGDAARTVREALFGWQEPLIEAMSKMQNARILLQGLEKDAANPTSAAASDLDYIFSISEKAHVSLDAVTDSFVKMKSAGIDPMAGGLSALVNSVAQFGGNSELMKRAAVAIQQMAGKGVVSMEELRQQLGEAVPTAMQAMADTMGVTMGELVKAVSTGTVSAKDALDKLFLGLSIDSAGAADRLSKSFTGAVAQMQTAFMRFADNMAKGGYLDALSDAIKTLSGFMSSQDGMTFAYSFGQALTDVVSTLKSVATWLTQNIGLVKTLAEIVAAGLGFKILKSVIGGTVGSALSLFESLNRTIEVTNKTSTALFSAFGKASEYVRRFGLIGAAVTGITEAIIACRTAWLSFTATLAVNPIVLAIGLVTAAVAALALNFESVADKAQDAFERIKAIPGAMKDADKAVIEQRIQQLQGQKDDVNRQIGILQDATPAQRDSIMKDRDWAAGGIEGLQKQRDSIEAEIKEKSEAIGQAVATGAVGGLVSKANSLIADAQKEADLGNQRFSSGGADYRKRLEDIQSNSGLTNEQKSAQRQSLLSERQGLNVSILQKQVDSITAAMQPLENRFEALDKAGNLSSEQQQERDALVRSIKSIREQKLEPVLQQLATARKSYSGKITSVGASFDIESAAKSLATKVSGQVGDFTDDIGQQLKDVFGKNITGQNQLKTNQYIENQLKKAGKTLDELNPNTIKSYQKALEDATLRDKQLSDKRVATANGQAAMMQSINAKIAASNQKVVDTATSLAAEMGLSTKASQDFRNKVDQSVTAMKNALADKDINGKALPENARFTESQKSQLRKSLPFIQGRASQQADKIDRNAAEQVISKFTTLATGTTSSYENDDRQRAAKQWQDDYTRDVKTLQDLIAQTPDDLIKNVYQRDLTAMQQGGTKAFIQQTGTATQKLALDYQDVGKQIENAWADVFSNLTDTLTDFVTTGKFSFSDLKKSILKDMAEIFVKSQIVAPLMNLLGMGTGQSNAQVSGGNQNIISSALNQGVSLVTDSTSQGAGAVDNGDKSVGQNAKSTSTNVGKLGDATKEVSGGFSEMISGVWDSTKSIFDSSNATKSQTSAIKTNIFSMKGLYNASTALTGVFAMMGASSNSTSGKWLGFLGTVGAGLTAAYASGGLSKGKGTSDVKPADVVPHANGGIFGPNGAVPLNTYSNGGIATKPQIALYGEGRDNEAYVPLPDGRSIPVTLTGGMMTGGGNTISPVNINISVQTDGAGSTSDSDNANWNKAAERMKSIALETIAQEKRPGGSLNQNSNGNR